MVLCRRYQSGHCRFGDNCWYEHDEDFDYSDSEFASPQQTMPDKIALLRPCAPGPGPGLGVAAAKTPVPPMKIVRTSQQSNPGTLVPPQHPGPAAAKVPEPLTKAVRASQQANLGKLEPTQQCATAPGPAAARMPVPPMKAVRTPSVDMGTQTDNTTANDLALEGAGFQKQVSELEDEVRRLKSMLDPKREALKYGILEEENGKLRDRNVDLLVEVKALKARESELRAGRDFLEGQLSVSGKSSQGLQADVEQLRREKDGFLKRFEECKAEIMYEIESYLRHAQISAFAIIECQSLNARFNGSNASPESHIPSQSDERLQEVETTSAAARSSTKLASDNQTQAAVLSTHSEPRSSTDTLITDKASLSFIPKSSPQADRTPKFMFGQIQKLEPKLTPPFGNKVAFEEDSNSNAKPFISYQSLFSQPPHVSQRSARGSDGTTIKGSMNANFASHSSTPDTSGATLLSSSSGQFPHPETSLKRKLSQTGEREATLESPTANPVIVEQTKRFKFQGVVTNAKEG